MNKKRVSIIITSITLIAVIAVGMTFALLQASTGTKTNTFSSNKNIDIQLRESAWDGYEFDSETVGDGSTAKPGQESNSDLGVNQAKSYLPGQSIPKNPQVKNTDNANSVDTYVAIRVRYYNTTGTKTQMTYNDFKTSFLEKENGIDFSEDWTLISDENSMDQVYIYGTKSANTLEATVLAKGATTSTALFDAVPLSIDLVPGENGMPQFAIEVQAFAIQATGVDKVQESMLDFVKAN